MDQLEAGCGDLRLALVVDIEPQQRVRRHLPVEGAGDELALALGRDAVTGGPLNPAMQAQAERIRRGVEAVRATGDLHGIPALIVTGRGDNILPPNFTSRAYLGLNRAKEGARSRLSYIEVTNAQHLDTIVSLPGLDSAYVPSMMRRLTSSPKPASRVLMYMALVSGASTRSP